MSDIQGVFLAELEQAGLRFGGPITIDDKVHRFKGGDDKDADSWYSLHLVSDGFVVGAYGSWRKNFVNKWSSRDKSQMSREDWANATRKWKESEAQRAEEERKAQEKARQRCVEFMSKFTRCEGHMYAMAKGIKIYGQVYESTNELTSGWMALPLQDIDGTVHSMQFIADDGTKRFVSGGRVKGCYFPISDIPGGPILICEGYATGASIYEATRWTTICALNCGNLKEVALEFRKRYPGRTIVLCADNDDYTEGNPGITKATEARKAIGGLMCYPEFSDSSEERLTDFNDLHQSAGLEPVASRIMGAFPIIARPIGLLEVPPKEDPSELIKTRYLCRKGALLFNGPSGTGKSSTSIQMAACFSNGIPFFGLAPTAPSRLLIVQAEDDDGDVAEMRNGVVTGLGFNEEQRKTFFNQTLIHTERSGATGEKFCKEILRPLLDLHQPDILMINPMFSFIGGDANKQEVVSTFLRGMINPLMFEYNCGVIPFHHTNKPPSGKEKNTWMNGDLAYLGSGSSEWANWARAVLSLQSLGKSGFYALNAAKRGSRLNWRDNNDELTFKKVIAWSKQPGLIYWRTPTDEEIASLSDDGATADEKAEREAAKVPQRFIEILAERSLTKDEWRRAAADRYDVSKTTAYRWIKALEAADRVFLSESTKRFSIVTPKQTDTTTTTTEPEQPELPV